VTYAFIAECQGQWPVAWLCDALDVSPAGYYAWRDRPISLAERRRRNLLGAMTDIHAEVRQCYGSPRMAVELNNRGFPCSENFVADLMKTCGMQAKMPKRFVRTTDSRHDLAVAENVLDRNFSPSGPNHAWGADITYLPTSEGWLYLAVVEDLFSRRRRLVDGRDDDQSARGRCLAPRVSPPPPRGRAVGALGSGQPIRQPTLPRIAPNARHRL
jgi:putative transposase